jgi:hypothetical protein
LRRYWCCCSAAAATVLLLKFYLFIYFFNDSWQVQESLTSLHVRARNIEQERTRELWNLFSSCKLLRSPLVGL